LSTPSRLSSGCFLSIYTQSGLHRVVARPLQRNTSSLTNISQLILLLHRRRYIRRCSANPSLSSGSTQFQPNLFHHLRPTRPTSSVATMSYDEKRFSDLIYDILRQSDLETVSAKKIRNALSEKLGYDVSEHKVSWPSLLLTPHQPTLTLLCRKRSNV
jgi:hypothetical protein